MTAPRPHDPHRRNRFHVSAIQALEPRLMLSAAPTIEMGGVGGIGFLDQGAATQITFTATDADSPAASVSLYYDRDTDPTSGKTLITSALTVSADEQTYNWNTTAVPPGLYYIYGVVNDGQTQAEDWFDGGYVCLAPSDPVATFDTSMGRFTVYLDQYNTPLTAANFVNYAVTGYYDGLIFHRVIENFMIQTGTFLPDLSARTPGVPIYNENRVQPENNLPNDVSVLAMALPANQPDAGTSGFYINTATNSGLDYVSDAAPGYATFGYVINGLGTVMDIGSVETETAQPPVGPPMNDVPVTPVVINSVSVDFPDMSIYIGANGVNKVVYTEADGTVASIAMDLQPGATQTGVGLLSVNGTNLNTTQSGATVTITGTVTSARLTSVDSDVAALATITAAGGADQAAQVELLGGWNIWLGAGYYVYCEDQTDVAIGQTFGFDGNAGLYLGEGAASASYTDADETLVRVAAKNARAMLGFSGEGDIALSRLNRSVTGSFDVNVSVLDSLSNGSLTFSTKGGDGLTPIQRITGQSPLAKITGRGVDIIGEGILLGGPSGYVGSVQLNSLSNGAAVEMQGAGPSAGVSLKFNTIAAGSTIELTPAIKSFYAMSCAADSISSPWAKAITVKGDFSSDLTLSGASSGYTLKSANIYGDVDGAQWKIDGAVSSIRIRGTTSGWTLEGDQAALGSVGSLKLGDVADSDVTASGLVKGLSAYRWLGGSIQADAISSLKITGNALAGLSGDFNVGLTLDNDLDNSLTLRSASIAGEDGGTWKLAGNVGSLNLRGRTDNWTLRGTDTDVLGSLKSLKLGEVGQASVTVDGLLRSLGAYRWETGSVSAGSASSIKINGYTRTGVVGDFGAALSLDGSGVADGAYTLGSLFVRGSLGEAASVTGHAKSISLGTMDADLTVTGNARSVKIVGTYLSMIDPGGPSTQLVLGGAGIVRCEGATYKPTGAVTFYANGANGYAFAELLPYNELSAWWGYASQFDGTDGQRSGNLENVVGSQLEAKQLAQGNVYCYPVTTSFEGDDLQTQFWYYDTQAHWAVWDYSGPMGTCQFTFSTGLSFPAELLFNQSYSVTSTVSAGVALVIPDAQGNLAQVPGLLFATSGQAEATVQWVGQEEVVFNGTTYSAAKIEMDMDISGSISLFTGPSGNYHMVQQQTLWCVPGIGVLAGEVSTVETLSRNGYATYTTTDSGSFDLAHWYGE